MKKYYLLTFNEDWADEHYVPALECFTEEDFNKWKKLKIYPSANLGNSGDEFCEDLQGLTGEQLLKDCVSKTVVDEAFYKVFHKASLGGLSLSCVFDLEQENPNGNGFNKEDLYETNRIEKGRKNKVCEHCMNQIKVGTSHDVHTFIINGDYISAPTHIECSKDFLDATE